MRRNGVFKGIGLAALAALLGGCLGSTPERVELRPVGVLRSGDQHFLLIDQHLQLSDTMLGALNNGIELTFKYWVSGCHAPYSVIVVRGVTLRYAPLRRAYELDQGDLGVRRFSRRSAMLAALERIRIPLPSSLPESCQGDVTLVLDLTRLPTPLRFPAFLKPAQWRLVSPSVPWQTSDA